MNGKHSAQKGKRFLIIVAVVAGLLLLTAAYGVFIEPRLLDEEHQYALIPNLPDEWEGKRAAFIGDFQTGLFRDNSGTVSKAVKAIVAGKPAFVVILGDFLYHSYGNNEDEIGTTVELVRPLVEAGIPAYALLGNHDYGISSPDGAPHDKKAERLVAVLEDTGIRVLRNESVRLPPEGEEVPGEGEHGRLYLVGVDSHWAGLDDADKALTGVPDGAPRVVVMHHPDSFQSFPAGTAPLALAGHTHGGQIRIPFTPEWSWMSFTKSDEVHADGWIPEFGEEGNRLYVNRGIGFSIFPIRLACMPELTWFTLHRETP